MEEKKKLTYEEYKEERKSAVKYIFGKFLLTLVSSYVPLALIFPFLMGEKQEPLVISVLIGVGLLILIIKKLLIDKTIKRLDMLRDSFTDTVFTEADIQGIEKKKKRLKRAAYSFCVVLVVGFFVYLGMSAYMESKKSNEYENALKKIDCHQYTSAREELEKFDSDYKDTKDLIVLCNAGIAYNNGNNEKAQRLLYNVDFHYLSEERLEDINRLKQKIDIALIFENADKPENSLEEEIKREKELNERIRTGVPFVGMPEVRINDTKLGHYSNKEVHKKMHNGKMEYDSTLYSFYSNNKEIFRVICRYGKVETVCNWINNPKAIFDYDEFQKNYWSERNPKKYNSFDEFYEDNWEDFYDEEDALDYYENNGGEI